MKQLVIKKTIGIFLSVITSVTYYVAMFTIFFFQGRAALTVSFLFVLMPFLVVYLCVRYFRFLWWQPAMMTVVSSFVLMACWSTLGGKNLNVILVVFFPFVLFQAASGYIFSRVKNNTIEQIE
ncbi:hypothetical protein QWI17_01325 [Gilvimarinus sp. SDUM040013]|uniref:Uncharacterized protein n=1 Tax=Gilvimarinus gilvus TaxID=3058038 RepID=A0ABU4S494_9GAMM|nr:hypothetical protein [Gilvimarinus sp. SDUM040013]MDO3384472.1 hypothetical protein [Gilvimarinus sp. SDUM040013]MDX6850713.1 hypothetical protein [Gilvimarinus sp. SDUM040013]